MSRRPPPAAVAQGGLLDEERQPRRDQQCDRSSNENCQIHVPTRVFQADEDRVADVLVREIEAIGDRAEEQDGLDRNDIEHSHRGGGDQQGKDDRRDHVDSLAILHDVSDAQADYRQIPRPPLADETVDHDADQERIGVIEDEDGLDDVDDLAKVMVLEHRGAGRHPSTARDVQQHQAQQIELDVSKLSRAEEHEHDRVKTELKLKRPVDRIDVADAQQLLHHRQINQHARQRGRAADQRQEAQDHKRQADGRPISGEQAEEPRANEIHRPPGAFQRHENDKPADQKKQLDAERPLRKRKQRRRPMVIHALIIAGVVVDQHGTGGQAAQHVQPHDASARSRDLLLRLR